MNYGTLVNVDLYHLIVVQIVVDTVVEINSIRNNNHIKQCQPLITKIYVNEKGTKETVKLEAIESNKTVKTEIKVGDNPKKREQYLRYHRTDGILDTLNDLLPNLSLMRTMRHADLTKFSKLECLLLHSGRISEMHPYLNLLRGIRLEILSIKNVDDDVDCNVLENQASSLRGLEFGISIVTARLEHRLQEIFKN
uniref:Uncharacterized protein n=1 Tax=Glossina brevipalpis TaxID=37001 RepID=A0A1A9WNZ9_9MUSC